MLPYDKMSCKIMYEKQAIYIHNVCSLRRKKFAATLRFNAKLNLASEVWKIHRVLNVDVESWKISKFAADFLSRRTHKNT